MLKPVACSLLTIVPVCLAIFAQHCIQEGRIAGIWEFVMALPTFHKVSTPRDVLSQKLGGRFQGPIPAEIELRPSDIWIITPPKSGTTWVTHIAHQLRVRGRPVDFEDQDDVVPWIEILDTDFLEGTAFNRDPNKDHAATPRVFKSHLDWDSIPAGSFRKVFVFREPADMLISTAKFLPTLWGILDPPTVSQLVSFFLWNGDLRSMMNNLVAVWRARHREDVLLLFYEDIIQDHVSSVRRLAEFMGIDADSALIALVVNQTSHATMTAQHSAFANRAQARNMYKARGLTLDLQSLVGKVRKDGGLRGSGSSLTSVFHDAIDRAWERHVFQQIGWRNMSALRAAHAQEVVRPLNLNGDVPPLVDVVSLWGSDDAAKREVGRALANAASTWGVARLKGHGVDTSALLNAAQSYFALPAERRGASYRNTSIGFQRGYIPFAGESGSADFIEVKEGFLYGYEWENGNHTPSTELEGWNVWPDDHEHSLGLSWRRTLSGYYDYAVRLARSVVQAVALEVGTEYGIPISEVCTGGDKISLMRMFNYLPRSHEPSLLADKLRLGSSPHTDWYLLTIIVRDVSSRLQVAGADASWHDVPALDGEILVLFGDYLSLHSRGKSHSPVHRVLLPNAGHSNSFVFLFSPNPHAPMLAPVKSKVPLPSGVKKVNTLLASGAQTPRMSFGDYIQTKRREVMRT